MKCVFAANQEDLESNPETLEGQEVNTCFIFVAERKNVEQRRKICINISVFHSELTTKQHAVLQGDMVLSVSQNTSFISFCTLIFFCTISIFSPLHNIYIFWRPYFIFSVCFMGTLSHAGKIFHIF